MASLIIATCGLSTVLIINASAKQSYSNTDTLLIGNVEYQVIAKSPQTPLTKQDYATLRQHGFDELIAIAQSSTHIFHNSVKLTDRRVVVTGIDTLSLLPIVNRGSTDQSNKPSLLG